MNVPPQPPPAQGWPFLIGAGRRHDYTTLLAPEFLIARREHGILDEVVTPTAVDAPARAIEMTTPSGHRLYVTYKTRQVTRDDVDDARDEHSRPLRVMFGFACPDARIDELAETDLDTARTAALDVYRRFLDNEDHFTAVPSAAFPLRSTITTPAVSEPTRRRPPTSATVTRNRPAVWALGAAAACAILAAIVLLIANTDDQPGQNNSPSPSPSATTTR
jgi:hypothetical protein